MRDADSYSHSLHHPVQWDSYCSQGKVQILSSRAVNQASVKVPTMVLRDKSA